MKLKESEVQKQILEYLQIKNVFHYRNNSGGMVTQYKGKQSFMRFGAVGSPDIVCVIDGIYTGIEVKGTGGKQSENQKAFQESLEQAGGRYILVSSLGDIIKII
jgi:hypothetical protein